jgi:hypothetical protein
LCGPLVFVDEATEEGPALDPLLGEVGGRVVGPRWAELEAAMGSLSVVMGLYSARIIRRWCRSPKISSRSMTSVRAVSTNLPASAIDQRNNALRCSYVKMSGV